jgi:hypothetical protein
MIKNIFKSAFLAALGLSLLTSCDEDTVTFNGKNFVSFPNVQFTKLATTEGVGTLNIPVTLSKTYNEPVTVTFEVTPWEGTVEGEDFTIPSRTVTIPAGEYTANFAVMPIDDDIIGNPVRTLDVTITSVSVASITVGLDNEGSYHKVVSIVNDDCPTKYTYFLGSLKINDSDSGDFYGTGDSNEDGECDILVVTGNLGGETAANINNSEFIINFTSENAEGTEGSVEVPAQTVGTRVSGGTTYITKYAGSGTYSTITGRIIINYQFQAFSGATQAGVFWSGVTTISLN